jgi:hypothetical protein
MSDKFEELIESSAEFKKSPSMQEEKEMAKM